MENRTAVPSLAHRGDLECDLELGERTISREEDLGGSAQAALLLAPDRFPGITEPRPAPHLHLAEDESPTATSDDVQLVPAGTGVRRKDAVAAEAVVEPDPPLGSSPRDLPRARHTSGPRRKAGESRTVRARARRRSAGA